jgi:phage terminase large subunit-like protein
VTKILKRTAENDRFFGFICCLDPCDEHWNEGQEQPVDNCPDCDDWSTEGAHWLKANPNLGVSIDVSYLRDQVRKGIDMPAEQNTVRRLNFGYWTNQAQRWLSMQAWDSCGGPINMDELRGRQCIVGLDLANKIDIAALVLLFPPKHVPITAKPQNEAQNGNGEQSSEYSTINIESLVDDFIVLPFFFIPKANVLEAERRDQVPYSTWIRQGFMDAVDSAIIEYDTIKEKLFALQRIYPLVTKWENGQTYHMVGYDPWNATQFANDMQRDHRINMIAVRQGPPTMSEPTKEMARLIKAKRFRHGGNPVMRWMADNVIVYTDRHGNVCPDKEKSKKKIDGIVGLIIALSLVTRFGFKATSNIYDERARAGDGPIVRRV